MALWYTASASQQSWSWRRGSTTFRWRPGSPCAPRSPRSQPRGAAAVWPLRPGRRRPAAVTQRKARPSCRRSRSSFHTSVSRASQGCWRASGASGVAAATAPVSSGRRWLPRAEPLAYWRCGRSRRRCPSTCPAWRGRLWVGSFCCSFPAPSVRSPSSASTCPASCCRGCTPRCRSCSRRNHWSATLSVQASLLQWCIRGCWPRGRPRWRRLRPPSALMAR
mmetsp:Transcript_22049/g.63256  ORF Transcript_22049/g.63256 Transcript_22049/m.63256 type:complete len:221 (+) Transcript_22049:19-681(+)